jgi:hypothetical protein
MLGRLLYGKWGYLGYTEMQYCDGDGKTVGIVHFYARDKNQKKRKAVYKPEFIKLSSIIYHEKEIVPWLEGGDMWKPILHPVAVKGTIINHLTKTVV